MGEHNRALAAARHRRGARSLGQAALLVVWIVVATDRVSAQPNSEARLTDQQVSDFAKLALANLNTEYPNKPSNVMSSAADVRSPRELHPAFYGCFDWHSSVHGHWMLARLLKLYPRHALADDIRQELAAHLSSEHLEREADYFRQPHNKSFERMYGWAWYLRLVEELHTWDDTEAQRWRRALVPLERIIVERTEEYLPKLTFAIRTGVHPNTAFALGQTHDYALAVNNQRLLRLVERRARDYFGSDRDYPTHYEPSGEDFFSAAWNEADLMRRVLPAQEFSDWLARFMPDLARENSSSLPPPVDVSDVTDGKIVHLAGLDLSRAWCMQGVAAALAQNDPRSEPIRRSARAHRQKGLSYVFSGHYEGEHWLATFAVYTLTK